MGQQQDRSSAASDDATHNGNVFIRLTTLAVTLGLTSGCGDNSDSFEFVVVTFNTGTSLDLGHDSVPPDDGYTEADAETADAFYGNGLSWPPAIDAARLYFETVNADVVAFQEIFHPGVCPAIPVANQVGFVCEMWVAGDPTVAQMILGPEYQVACHLRKPDKCIGVKRAFATIRGCVGDVCLDGLAGAPVSDCGSGARVGRAVLELVGGGSMTVATVHGSSGLAGADQDCRAKQFDQIFVDLDGEPAANGSANLVIGDLNTDPVRFAGSDVSADRFLEFVGPDKPFGFITDVGESADPTYFGLFNIDHLASDRFTGHCEAAGLSDGAAAVIDATYFDHVPIACTVKGERP